MRALLWLLALSLLAACSTSGSSGTPDATVDTAAANQCTAYGEGYVCQTGPTCGAGYIDKEDYFCGSSGQLCCGPVGEGGVDATDDVNVFVDGAVFETGTADAAHHDASADASHHDASGASDATTEAGHPHDAAVEASHHRDAAMEASHHHDAGSDAGHHDDAHGAHDARHD